MTQRPLDTKLSVESLRVSTDFTFMLSNENEEEVEEETEKKEEKEGAREEEESKLNPNGPAKDIKKPAKAGWIQSSHGLKKKFETNWLILKKNYLLQYKAQTAPRPLTVFDLSSGDMVARKMVLDEKQKKTKEYISCFEVVDKKKKDTWIFKCENDNHLKDWMEKLELASKLTPEKMSTGYFGRELSQIVPEGKQLPNLVEQCTRYIDQKALDHVGIFRLSGSAVKIEEYKNSFDRGERPDLMKEQDPHAIAGLLKLYFRNLPEPLLTFDLYEQFIAAQCNQLSPSTFLSNMFFHF